MKTKYFTMFIALVFLCGIVFVCYTIAGEIRDKGGELTNETDNMIRADNNVEEGEVIDVSEELIIETDQIISVENTVEDDIISDYIITPDGQIYISDDGGFQAFVSSIDRSRYNNIEVTVVNNSSGVELIIPLSRHTLNLHDLEFIENSIAITGYVNPSLGIHEIFSLEDGKRLSYREGRGFTFDSNGELYYVQSTFPHSSFERGYDRIVNEQGDVLYESEYGVTIVVDKLYIDQYTIGFFERTDQQTNTYTYKNINKLHTSEGLIIELPERIYISDDGGFQAFVSSIDWNRNNNIEVTVVNNSSGAELIIPLSIDTLHLEDIEFIDNLIAITGYMNPSLRMLEIFRLDNGERLNYRAGRGFTFDSNNELYYIQETFPHYSDNKGHDRIVNENGDVLYESEYGVSIVVDKLYIDEYTIGFFEDTGSDRAYKVISKFL